MKLLISAIGLVCLLAASINASVLESLRAVSNEGISLARRSLSRSCVNQGTGCLRPLSVVERGYLDSLFNTEPFHTGEDYQQQICAAGQETIECMGGIEGDCQELFLNHTTARMDFVCSTRGREILSRLDGTTCSRYPSVNSRIRACRRRLCTSHDEALECLRAHWISSCNTAYADFSTGLLYPLGC